VFVRSKFDYHSVYSLRGRGSNIGLRKTENVDITMKRVKYRVTKTENVDITMQIREDAIKFS